MFAGDQATHDIPLTQIRGATVIERKSFRHPWLGLAFALALLIPSAWLVATKYLDAPVALLIKGPGLAALFGLAFGGWALFELCSAPRIISLRIQTNAGTQELILPGASRAELDEFVRELRQAVSLA
jgi:hypothetical protein